MDNLIRALINMMRAILLEGDAHFILHSVLVIYKTLSSPFVAVVAPRNDLPSTCTLLVSSSSTPSELFYGCAG